MRNDIRDYMKDRNEEDAAAIDLRRCAGSQITKQVHFAITDLAIIDFVIGHMRQPWCFGADQKCWILIELELIVSTKLDVFPICIKFDTILLNNCTNYDTETLK